MSGWAAKQAKKAEWAEQRTLDGLDGPGGRAADDARDAAMGKGAAPAPRIERALLLFANRARARAHSTSRGLSQAKRRCLKKN